MIASFIFFVLLNVVYAIEKSIDDTAPDDKLCNFLIKYKDFCALRNASARWGRLKEKNYDLHLGRWQTPAISHARLGFGSGDFDVRIWKMVGGTRIELVTPTMSM